MLEFMYIYLIGSISSSFIHHHGFKQLMLLPLVTSSKAKFIQAICHCKRVLESTKFAYTNTVKESITSKKLGSCNFSNKVLLSVSDKENILCWNLFSKPLSLFITWAALYLVSFLQLILNCTISFQVKVPFVDLWSVCKNI